MFALLRRDSKKWNHKKIYRLYRLLKLNKRRKGKQRLPSRAKQPLQPQQETNQSWASNQKGSTQKKLPQRNHRNHKLQQLLPRENKNDMRIKLVLLITMLLQVNLSYTQQGKKVHIYITPKHVNYGWGDNGVFHFKFRKKSITSLYEDKKYYTSVVKDKVYELYYTKVKMPDSLCNNLKPIEDDCFHWAKRIMIIHSRRDTVFINSQYQVIKEGKCYEASKALKNFIEELMPEEIRRNWNNDVYIRKGDWLELQ